MATIDFSMIVFNGDYTLKQNLENIYDFAHKIIISEGPVSYYRNLGYTSSTDKTLEIINNFPDPQNKIVLIQKSWEEKDDMIKAQEKYYDCDYVWVVDSDELYKTEDMHNIINYLKENPNCYSMAFRLFSFYGGLERYITGYEEHFPVIRIQKFKTGKSTWLTHRPPTVLYDGIKSCKQLGHIDHYTSEKLFGTRIYHYSYVFPNQVIGKLAYYKSRGGNGVINNYIDNLYKPWMRAKDENKLNIEKPFLGVQENTPNIRGEAYTTKFIGKHPEIIEKNLEIFNKRIDDEKKRMEYKCQIK